MRAAGLCLCHRIPHSLGRRPQKFRGQSLTLPWFSPAGKLCFGGGSTQGTLGSASKEMEMVMAMAYWVATYRSISDPEALAGYAKLAGPAITAAGGRFLARGTAARAYEAGLIQRVVIIEFDSVEKAAAAHDSEGYQAALKVLGKAADRDLRIVDGVE
jgi:uncharacterized protein (DUF1330 family)